jgi:hypothetical protein
MRTHRVEPGDGIVEGGRAVQIDQTVAEKRNGLLGEGMYESGSYPRNIGQEVGDPVLAPRRPIEADGKERLTRSKLRTRGGKAIRPSEKYKAGLPRQRKVAICVFLFPSGFTIAADTPRASTRWPGRK